MKTPHMTAAKHLNITKQMHIDGSSSVCFAKCKQMYIVKIGIPPGTGRALLRRANAGLAGVHFILCDSLFNV